MWPFLILAAVFFILEVVTLVSSADERQVLPALRVLRCPGSDAAPDPALVDWAIAMRGRHRLTPPAHRPKAAVPRAA